MLSSLFDASTIPMLEQVVHFTQARHGVLAGNIANLDTPGYKTRDLSPVNFQNQLKEAIKSQQSTAQTPSYAINAELAGKLNESTRHDEWHKVRETTKDILYHDNSDVGIEQQITEIAKNQGQHNMALTIMNSQFRLLRAAITERV